MPSIHKPRGVIITEGSVKIPDLPDAQGMQMEGHDKRTITKDGKKNPTKADLPRGPENPPEVIVQQVFTPLVMSRMELTEYYHAELADISRAASEKAYTEAIIKKRGELMQCIKQVETGLEEVQNLQNKFMTQYAQELKYFAIDVAEKMICDKINKDDKVLKKLVMQTVDSVKNSAWLDIELSEKLVALIDEIRAELQKAELQGRVTISAKAHSKSTCRINSEEGTVVSSIEVQAENLRKLFHTAEESQ